MAESIVTFILGKLEDATVQELLHLCGVHKQIKSLSKELVWIQTFLKDADRTNNIGDDHQRHWVKEVRDVAYDIEDAIDKACLLGIEIEDSKKGHSKWEVAKRKFKSPNKLPAQHDLVVEINEILERIKKISKSREKDIELPVKPLMIPIYDDPDIVGFDHDRDNIIKELLDENTKKRCVISIVGAGGIGKTTLARKIFNSPGVKTNFNPRIFVTISQKFKLVDILRKLLQEIRCGPIKATEQTQQEDYFHKKVYESLRERKYLVVLDDVWTDRLWFQIKEAFPDTKNGSRLLMTTRFFDVAKNANPTCEPYKLPYLTEELSLALLLKKALPNQEPNKGYPNNLYELAKELIKRCGGLPLALVLLGGLLSKQKPDDYSWRQVLKRMDWLDDTSKVLAAASYGDLPFSLKSCFMYFALFPKNYKIIARNLIQMWVAEGFIPHNDKEGTILEDIAENFLVDLVQRNMVQVSRRGPNGSIEVIYLHNFLHDIAIRKAEEDNFLSVSSNPDDHNSCSGARRVAIHRGKCDELMKDTSSNLRSLFCFNELPDISGHRQLKILSHLRRGFHEPRGSYEISTPLRYLQLSLGHYSIHFEGSKNMSFLQTINVRLAWSVELPESIWHIKTLRHVLLSQVQPNPGPPQSVHMRNLQTLSGVTTRLSWNDEGLPNLPCLRELEIEVEERFPCEVLVTFICTMKHLESLIVLCFPPWHQNEIRNAFKNVKFERDLHPAAVYLGDRLTVQFVIAT